MGGGGRAQRPICVFISLKNKDARSARALGEAKTYLFQRILEVRTYNVKVHLLILVHTRTVITGT
jgi:hypothetical protein